MTTDQISARDPRIQAGLSQLQTHLRTHYPEATFAVVPGDDPEGIYLVVTVDVEDTDAVLDVVIDDLFQLQVEESLPLYVMPALPLARVAEQLRHRAAASLPPLLPA